MAERDEVNELLERLDALRFEENRILRRISVIATTLPGDRAREEAAGRTAAAAAAADRVRTERVWVGERVRILNNRDRDRDGVVLRLTRTRVIVLTDGGEQVTRADNNILRLFTQKR